MALKDNQEKCMYFITGNTFDLLVITGLNLKIYGFALKRNIIEYVFTFKGNTIEHKIILNAIPYVVLKYD